MRRERERERERGDERRGEEELGLIQRDSHDDRCGDCDQALETAISEARRPRQNIRQSLFPPDGPRC